jgi:DNA-directed RNA polymerase specialized sigma24 family protein
MQLNFEQTIRENSGVLHKLCRVYTENSAEYDDLFQEIGFTKFASTRRLVIERNPSAPKNALNRWTEKFSFKLKLITTGMII